jgi:hypothetical protein
MLQIFCLRIKAIATNNYVAFTFFVGTMAMMAMPYSFFYGNIGTAPQ